jgi:hypothetical protein
MPNVIPTKSSSFTWTTEEIRTKTGFLVGPGNKNPAAEEITYLVLRIDDERSSTLCREIERMSRTNGGIVIRVGSISEQDVLSMGFSSAYHTHLFHENCRCRLMLRPKAMAESIDELDFMMAAGPSAMSYNTQYEAEKKLEASVLTRAKAFEYRAAIQKVVSINKLIKDSLLARKI